jgi:hypothetical protein
VVSYGRCGSWNATHRKNGRVPAESRKAGSARAVSGEYHWNCRSASGPRWVFAIIPVK